MGLFGHLLKILMRLHGTPGEDFAKSGRVPGTLPGLAFPENVPVALSNVSELIFQRREWDHDHGELKGVEQAPMKFGPRTLERVLGVPSRCRLAPCQQTPYTLLPPVNRLCGYHRVYPIK